MGEMNSHHKQHAQPERQPIDEIVLVVDGISSINNSVKIKRKPFREER